MGADETPNEKQKKEKRREPRTVPWMKNTGIDMVEDDRKWKGEGVFGQIET